MGLIKPTSGGSSLATCELDIETSFYTELYIFYTSKNGETKLILIENETGVIINDIAVGSDFYIATYYMNSVYAYDEENKYISTIDFSTDEYSAVKIFYKKALNDYNKIYITT